MGVAEFGGAADPLLGRPGGGQSPLVLAQRLLHDDLGVGRPPCLQHLPGPAPQRAHRPHVVPERPPQVGGPFVGAGRLLRQAGRGQGLRGLLGEDRVMVPVRPVPGPGGGQRVLLGRLPRIAETHRRVRQPHPGLHEVRRVVPRAQLRQDGLQDGGGLVEAAEGAVVPAEPQPYQGTEPGPLARGPPSRSTRAGSPSTPRATAAAPSWSAPAASRLARRSSAGVASQGRPASWWSATAAVASRTAARGSSGAVIRASSSTADAMRLSNSGSSRRCGRAASGCAADRTEPRHERPAAQQKDRHRLGGGGPPGRVQGSGPYAQLVEPVRRGAGCLRGDRGVRGLRSDDQRPGP
ncbi:hypothetical protein VO63_36850 [Streptomyces showdoensis]|uniref:Uncharacterized protein n=1 Tax=Streptomyces showdoensis TaxID=68268 RepID=A0A2P2GDV1_STREW|nr:hypothetical protein VO63_36850 [Streptomyces showdoensis]